MSIIAGLLGWSKLPQWALELIVIAGLVAGLFLYHHHVYETGIKAQRQADRVASAKIEAQAAAATEAAQEAADRASEAYRNEIADNAARAAIHPLGPVRLCLDSGPGMPEAGAPVSGATDPGAPSGGVQSMPAGDSGLRGAQHPDISGLLSAFGRRADQVSAQLREYQHR